jgi:hypothetical protein
MALERTFIRDGQRRIAESRTRLKVPDRWVAIAILCPSFAQVFSPSSYLPLFTSTFYLSVERRVSQ